jgi:hypothetical protein
MAALGRIVAGSKAYFILKSSRKFGGPAMPVSTDVEKEFKSAKAVVLEVKKTLNSKAYTGEEYSTVVAGIIDQVIEHLESVMSLVRSNFVGSAFALVRPVAEGARCVVCSRCDAGASVEV